MKITLSWLRDHLDTMVEPKEIARMLVNLGHEVEDLLDTRENFKALKIAEIVAIERHPNADKLQICEVDFGEKYTAKVVCGAPNARQGLLTVYACEGAYIPSFGEKLKKAKIRGVESSGMLCSAKELGIGENHTGIIDLDVSFKKKVGEPLTIALGLGDVIFDIGLTPNRADCFSVFGLARDLSCTSVGTLKALKQHKLKGSFFSPIQVTIDKNALQACPHFTGRLIRGVKNGPSPQWLKDKLKSVGLKSISALVDVTNYFCHDQARPLHVFDADKLQGNLNLRLSKKGESFDALDDKTYMLDEGMLVIDDEKGIISLAGVMGGLASGCSEATTNVFLESAYFDPITVAKTGQKLNIISDARTRFERGIDPQSTFPALDASAQMILDLCGGEISEVVTVGASPYQLSTIEFDSKEVKKIIGYDVEADKCKKILQKLGCYVEDTEEGKFIVTPPSWRHDMSIKEDLVEEIIRIIGYGSIPLQAMPSEDAFPHILDKNIIIERTKRLLAARGLMETIVYSFISKNLAELFSTGGIEVKNPISENMKYMRDSLIPGLVEAIQRNLSRNVKNLRFFEVGARFNKNLTDYQEMTLGAVYCGSTARQHWSKSEKLLDLQKVKSDIEAILEEYGLIQGKYQIIQNTDKLPTYMHPGKSALICQGPKRVLGYFGKIHPGVLNSLGIKESVSCFELYLDRLPVPKSRAKNTLKVSSFQSVERDFAFIVNESVLVENLQTLLIKAGKNLVQWVDVFDVYQGKGIEKGKKSVALRVRLQAYDCTLNEDDIKTYNDTALKLLEEKTGAILR